MAPSGMLTVREACLLAEVNPVTVYRRVRDGAVTSIRDPSGALFVAHADLPALRKIRAKGAPRVAISLRPVVARHAAWVAAAGGRPVSVWLGEVADAAARVP